MSRGTVSKPQRLIKHALIEVVISGVGGTDESVSPDWLLMALIHPQTAHIGKQQRLIWDHMAQLQPKPGRNHKKGVEVPNTTFYPPPPPPTILSPTLRPIYLAADICTNLASPIFPLKNLLHKTRAFTSANS